MTVLESLLVALFCIAGVFLVLFCLCVLIKLFSSALGSLINKKAREPVSIQQPAPAAGEDFSSGNLKLRDVDEPTAAMIMAIVSDESGVPLSELRFQSIKLLRQD